MVLGLGLRVKRLGLRVKGLRNEQVGPSLYRIM